MKSRIFRRGVGVGFACLLAWPSGVRAQKMDLGPLPGETGVNVRLYLAPSAEKMAALDQFLVDVQDVGSPSYRHWLTPAEFGARFGADATAVAQVRSFAQAQGFGVEVAASGLRVTLRGTATQIEAVFAPGLHGYQAGAVRALANTVVPLRPAGLSANVVAMSGFDTVTPDLMAQLGDVVDENLSPVAALKCVAEVSAADRVALELGAKQAAAQGISVLAAGGCGVGFSEMTAVVLAPGLGAPAEASEARPPWQWAPGLPEDGLRYVPDMTVADVDALKHTLLEIAASMPASAGGRLGNINATLYRMAPIPGVFKHTDGTAAGTWEAATGLGLVDLVALLKVYPRGSYTVNVSGSATNYAPTHGQAITLMSTVTDISGLGGGVVPTGTISFALSNGTPLGTVAMVNGSASLTTNVLPGGTDDVIASYSGDANFAAGQGFGIYINVQGEPAVVTAAVGPSVTLGDNTTVGVTVTSASGLGTPSGSATVSPQGNGNAPTYTAPLVGSNGTASATVTVPALAAGAIVMLVNCVSADQSFTCYSPIRVTAVVKQAASGITFTVSPNPPVTGATTTFIGTVTGVAAPAPGPTGNVQFYDNGALLGTVALVNGTATYTNAMLTSAPPVHSFSASYSGDSNYMSSTAAVPGVVPPTVTTTTLAVAPNPPVSGGATTLTATVGYTSMGVAATGAVQFFEDTALIGTGTVNALGVATFSGTTITGTTAHSFYAAYAGDSNYAASQSAAVTTQANTATIATTTGVSGPSGTVNTGSMVTLTATIVPASSTGTAPTGTVSFTSSTQGLLGTATVSGATATLPVALTMAGTQSITATYSGDASYRASTSAPVVVTVGTVITPVILTVTPSTGASYSTPVSATVSVAGVSTTTGAGPAGSVVFTIAAAGTATPLTSTVAITPSSTTAGSAVYTFAAPAPGTYTVTATCTGTNFTCAASPVFAPLVTVKGSTVTTVTAIPAAVTAGATVTLTATVVAASPLATSSAFTGTVTFYNTGGAALGMGTVSGNQAVLVTSFASVTGNVITAVYAGDVDWSSSTSAALTLTASVVPTTATVRSSVASILQGNNVVFTATVVDAPSATVPTPATPNGVVTFYDLYNGQTALLGTGTLSATGPFQAVAQLSTTGLFHGVHNVMATFAGGTVFGASTGSTTMTVTDYSVTFSPASLTLTAGAAGVSTMTIASLNGFAGTVSLACIPPANAGMTCAFRPATVATAGTSTLTITTTAPHVRTAERADWRGTELGVSLAAVLGWVVFPRRRRPVLLALLALCGLLGVSGCGAGGTAAAGPTGGSPAGTVLFTIVTSGNDGTSTNRHDSQFQVTIP